MESTGAMPPQPGDPHTAADIDLDAELNQVAGHLNAQHARLVDLCVVMIGDRSKWAGPGVERPELYLAWKVGLSNARAKQIVEIAERAIELPTTLAAFRRGELAIDQVLAIVRRSPWWADREVCDLARNATVYQLTSALGKYPFPDIPNPDAPAIEPEVGSAVEASVDAGPGRPDPRTPVMPVPVDRLWFGTGADDRFRLNVECDQLTGMIITKALEEARDGICCDDRGRRLPDALARHISCDGLLTPTFVDGNIPISVGRSARMIPERTRRLVVLRDEGCTVPGCTATHILEVHHIIHWEHDGPTDTWNLIALCPHHHRMHHRGELGIAGNADEGTVVFTNASGKELEPSGARPEPPGAPPPTPAGVYQHPLGERLDTEWLSFSPPPEHRTRHRADHRWQQPA